MHGHLNVKLKWFLSTYNNKHFYNLQYYCLNLHPLQFYLHFTIVFWLVSNPDRQLSWRQRCYQYDFQNRRDHEGRNKTKKGA